MILPRGTEKETTLLPGPGAVMSANSLLQATDSLLPESIEPADADSLVDAGGASSPSGAGLVKLFDEQDQQDLLSFSPLPMIGSTSRLQKIGRVNSYWTTQELRNLFRMVDTKQEGQIDYEGFLQAINVMGFDTSNEAAITQLHAAADLDGDGLIRETHFANFFTNLSRKNIAARLMESEKSAKAVRRSFLSASPDKNKYQQLQQLSHHVHDVEAFMHKHIPSPRRRSAAADGSSERESGPVSTGMSFKRTIDGTKVRIVDFGLDRGRGKFDMQSFNSGLGLLDSKPKDWEHGIRWIDVESDSREVVELLGNLLDLPPHSLEKYGFKQPGNVRFYAEQRVLQFLTHAISLENLPLTQRKSSGEPQLVKGSKYSRNSPLVKVLQILVVVRNRTVLSFHRPTSNNTLRAIFDDLPGDIKTFSQTLRSAAHMTTPTGFALSLLKEITEQNWVLRDNFKDWKIELEADMLKKTSPQHTGLILDLGRNASLARKVVRPWLLALGEVLGMKHEDYSEYTEGLDFENPRQFAQHSRRSTIVGAKALGDDLNIRQRLGAAAKPNKAAKRASVVHWLDAKEVEVLRDIHASISRLDTNFAFAREISHELLTMHNNMHNQRINKTLYILTVVTTVVAPLQLLSAIYGMNFDNMPELRISWAYFAFWGVCLFYTLVAVTFVYSRGILG
eukprot:g2617.t1